MMRANGAIKAYYHFVTLYLNLMPSGVESNALFHVFCEARTQSISICGTAKSILRRLVKLRFRTTR